MTLDELGMSPDDLLRTWIGLRETQVKPGIAWFDPGKTGFRLVKARFDMSNTWVDPG